MKNRRSLVFLFGPVAMLAACSSNATLPGGGTSGTLQFVSGSHYSFQNAQYGSVTEPSPSPIATRMWSDAEGLTKPASFEGTGNLIDLINTRQIRGKTGTVTQTTNDYFSESSSQGQTVISRVGSSGDSVTMRYMSPATVLEFPFRAGNSWNAAVAYQLTSPEGSETWNRDGSFESQYDFKLSLNGKTSTVHERYIVRSDGSAISVAQEGDCVPNTLSVGVPVRIHGKYIIPVEIRQANSCKGPVISGEIPAFDWYPGGKLPPSPLVTANSTDEGRVAIPSACHVPPSVATTAEKILRRRTAVNPFGVFEEQRDSLYYAQPLGLVCTDSNARQVSYLFGHFPAASEVQTTNIKSMQSFSAGAGAALDGGELVEAQATFIELGACLASQRAGRNTWAGDSSIPALCRPSQTGNARTLPWIESLLR